MSVVDGLICGGVTGLVVGFFIGIFVGYFVGEKETRFWDAAYRRRDMNVRNKQ